MDTQATFEEKMRLTEKRIYQCVHLLKSIKNVVIKFCRLKILVDCHSHADLNSQGYISYGLTFFGIILFEPVTMFISIKESTVKYILLLE